MKLVPLHLVLKLFTEKGILAKADAIAKDLSKPIEARSVALGITNLFNGVFDNLDLDLVPGLLSASIALGIATAQDIADLETIGDAVNPPISNARYVSPNLSGKEDAIKVVLRDYISLAGGDVNIHGAVDYVMANLPAGVERVDGESLNPLLMQVKQEG